MNFINCSIPLSSFGYLTAPAGRYANSPAHCQTGFGYGGRIKYNVKRCDRNGNFFRFTG